MARPGNRVVLVPVLKDSKDNEKSLLSGFVAGSKVHNWLAKYKLQLSPPPCLRGAAPVIPLSWVGSVITEPHGKDDV